MAIDATELLTRQRRRLLASLLGFCERQPWHARLTPAERQHLREQVLAATGAYHDLMLDLLRSEDATFNGVALQLLDQVHTTVLAAARTGVAAALEPAPRQPGAVPPNGPAGDQRG